MKLVLTEMHIVAGRDQAHKAARAKSSMSDETWQV